MFEYLQVKFTVGSYIYLKVNLKINFSTPSHRSHGRSHELRRAPHGGGQQDQGVLDARLRTGTEGYAISRSAKTTCANRRVAVGQMTPANWFSIFTRLTPHPSPTEETHVGDPRPHRVPKAGELLRGTYVGVQGTERTTTPCPISRSS